MARKKKLRKSHLRACAKVVLEQRGFAVAIKPGAGIVTGARLRTCKGSDEFEVAVRTSLDREIGFTRRLDGTWLTVPNVDEVVVVVPSALEPACAEVISFKPGVLIDVFDRALADLKERNAAFSPKAPVFVSLDAAGVETGLIARAEWTSLVPFDSVPQTDKSATSFIDRVKREFAALMGVDVNCVIVEFRIIS